MTPSAAMGGLPAARTTSSPLATRASLPLTARQPNFQASCHRGLRSPDQRQCWQESSSGRRPRYLDLARRNSSASIFVGTTSIHGELAVIPGQAREEYVRTAQLDSQGRPAQQQLHHPGSSRGAEEKSMLTACPREAALLSKNILPRPHPRKVQGSVRGMRPLESTRPWLQPVLPLYDVLNSVEDDQER